MVMAWQSVVTSPRLLRHHDPARRLTSPQRTATPTAPGALPQKMTKKFITAV